MLRRAVFTSSMDSTTAADLYERFLEILEAEKICWLFVGASVGWFAGLLMGAFLGTH
jgi:pimeloyl-ACP methyl ester carboxylesterase